MFHVSSDGEVTIGNKYPVGDISTAITKLGYNCLVTSRALSAFCSGCTRLVSATCMHAILLYHYHCRRRHRNHHLHLLLLCSFSSAHTVKVCNSSGAVDAWMINWLECCPLWWWWLCPRLHRWLFKRTLVGRFEDWIPACGFFIAPLPPPQLNGNWGGGILDCWIGITPSICLSTVYPILSGRYPLNCSTVFN